MDLRRKADILLTYVLQTDWREVAGRRVLGAKRRVGQAGLWLIGSAAHVRHMRRRDWALVVRDLGRRVRRIDIRKPVHAVVIGVTLAVIVAPVSAWLSDNEHYRLDGDVASVVTKPAPHLKDKLTYEQAKQQVVFNADGQKQVADEAKDALTARVGGAEKKTTQLYTATFPDDPAKGIVVNDNVSQVAVTFKPQFGLMNGRDMGGRVVYPLKGQSGQVVFTPKANAMKEDILLASSPGDSVDYKYQLVVPDSLQARLDSDGSIGVYSGDPALFGDITFGSDKDRADVMAARAKSLKSHLMFRIPAPVVLQAGGKESSAYGRFGLHGDILTLHVAGLAKASYPLSIDPTFYLSTTADFLLGESDDNVDLSVANQVGRSKLTGGSLTAWTTLANAPFAAPGNFAFGMTAYNGYLYAIGGGNSGSTSVRYAPISLTTGDSTGAWAVAGTMNTARVGLGAIGYNGFIYAFGGENGAGNAWFNTIEYAQINANGTLGAFTTSGNTMTTARSFIGATVYAGVIYAAGGETAALNSVLTNTVEYARLNGDGSVDTWHAGTNLPSARDRFGIAAYNYNLYEYGGLTNSTTTTNDTRFAPISADGSIGAWKTTTSFPVARRDFGVGMERGHAYIYAGCTTGIACSNFLIETDYAVVNADGTLGQWQQTNNTTGTARDMIGTTFYNGHLYSAGGCTVETAASNDCNTARTSGRLTSFDVPGRYDGQSAQATSPFNPQASSSARFGGQAVALNGYVYYIGGTASTTGATYSSVVSYAAIGTDGSLGAWSTTTALTAQTNDNAGRVGHTLAAYRDKIYVIGGVELLTAGGRSYMTSVISSTQATNGTLGAWGAEAALPAVTAFHTTVIWNNYIYAIGGRDSTATVKNKVYYSLIGSTGTLGTWSTSGNNIGTATWAHSSVLYGNTVFLFSGSTNTTGTLTTTTQMGTIGSSGDISGWTTDRALPATRMYARALIQNDFVYVYGGQTGGTTQTTIYWAQLTPAAGGAATIGAWSNTNIGDQSFNGTDGLTLARGAEAAVAVDGVHYLIGGCGTGMSSTVFDSCTTIRTATTTTETESYLVNDGGTGQTNTWCNTSPTCVTTLTTAKADAASVAYNGYLYTIGGCTGYTAGVCTGSGQYSNEVRYAPISTAGVVGSWTAATNQLGTATMLLQAAAYNGYMYVLGGKTNATAAVTTVSYAAIGSTGDIGAWSSGTAMNAARNSFGAAISSGYLYVAGGIDASGTKLASEEYALLNADGSLGSWTTAANSFTTARSALGVVAYAGFLYVVGGSDGSGAAITDIQYSQLNSGTGAPGAFANTIAVPRGMIARQVYANNGYMYFLGNEGATQEVSYASIGSKGVLGMLQDQPSALAGAHAHGSVAFFNGYFYDLGGCTLSSGACNTVSGTGESAGQQAVSRQAHYVKLWDTQGVDTAPSQITVNGTLSGPGSAVASSARTSSTSDPVLGVPQVINPTVFNTFYRIFPLNSSGTNVGVAKTYFLEITLDDTQTGTFPDINQNGTQTAVSSITLYYHANPSRRLRHGASFSNVGCNITPANGCILDTAP